MRHVIFRKKTDINHEARRCYDCRHMQAAITWWCKHPTASALAGSDVGKFSQCPYWEPALTLEEAEPPLTYPWWRRALHRWGIWKIPGVVELPKDYIVMDPK